MNIYQFLADFSPKRMYDGVVVAWYQKKYGPQLVSKSKAEWEKVIAEFMSETEAPKAKKAEPKKQEEPKKQNGEEQSDGSGKKPQQSNNEKGER